MPQLVKENEQKTRRMENLRDDLNSAEKSASQARRGGDPHRRSETSLRHAEKIQFMPFLRRRERISATGSEEGGGAVSAWRSATQALRAIAGA